MIGGKAKARAKGPRFGIPGRWLFFGWSALRGPGSGENRVIGGAGAREHDGEADGSEHKDNRRIAGQLGEQIGGSAGTKGCLGALATKGTGEVSRLARLQEHDANEKEADNDVAYNEEVEQKVHVGDQLPSLEQNSCRRAGEQTRLSMSWALAFSHL